MLVEGLHWVPFTHMALVVELLQLILSDGGYSAISSGTHSAGSRFR